MARTPFKILTVRDAVDHTDMLYDLMDAFGSKSAASSLIKSGYAYLEVRKQLEQLRAEHARLNKKVRKMEEGTNLFFESLEKMKEAASSS